MKYYSFFNLIGKTSGLFLTLLILFFAFSEKEFVQGQEDGEINCFKEIHIGEVIDETETYGQSLLVEYEDLYDNAVLAKDSGFTAVAEATNLLSSIDSEKDGANFVKEETDINEGNCKKCNGGCHKGTCTCAPATMFNVPEALKWPGCIQDTCVDWVMVDIWPVCIEYDYQCPYCKGPCTCSACYNPIDGLDNPCDMDLVNSYTTFLKNSYNDVVGKYNNIVIALTDIQSYNNAISTALTNINDLTIPPVVVISPTPTQISAKLDTARKDLLKCITPYECWTQILSGEDKCIIKGKTFTIQVLFTCPTLKNFDIDKARCDEEAADFNKANNFFCCELIY